MQEEGIAVIEPLADLDHLTTELKETLLCFVLVGPGSQHAFCSRWDGWLAQGFNRDAGFCFLIVARQPGYSAAAAKHVVRAPTCSLGSASAKLLPMACSQRVHSKMISHTLQFAVPGAGTTLGRGRSCRASCQRLRISPEWVCASSVVAAAAPQMAACLHWSCDVPCAPRPVMCSCIALQCSPLQHGTKTTCCPCSSFRDVSAVHPHGLATIAAALQILCDTRAVHLNGFVLDELPPELVVAMLSEARQAGAAVFFDPGPRQVATVSG